MSLKITGKVTEETFQLDERRGSLNSGLSQATTGSGRNDLEDVEQGMRGWQQEAKEAQMRGRRGERRVMSCSLLCITMARWFCHCCAGVDFRRTASCSAGSIYKSHSRPSMFERLISVTENSVSPAENMHSIQMTVGF